MNLPGGVRAAIESEVGRIDRSESVSGGSIGVAYAISAGGQRYFLKYARNAAPDFFEVEAAGLDLLRNAGSGLIVPRVVAVGIDEGTGWLLLEWLEAARMPTFSIDLGHGLGLLHGHPGSGYGWERDGFIGSLPQSNRKRPRWADFWWEERLLPQIRAAEPHFSSGVGHDVLRTAVGRALDPIADEGPSLLHGDLWGGNVMSTTTGPAIIDPACYFGHSEVDLAMTQLFGGFDARFYGAYDEVRPRRPGYEARRAAYQLYYLLVHVNLFGGAYVTRTRDTLRDLLAA